LVIGFIEHLEIVTTTLSLIHTLYGSLQHARSLFILLCLHRLPGNGFQSCSFFSFRIHVLTGRRLTFRPLYPQRKSPRYPLDRGLGGPQSRCGQCGEKYLTPAENRTPGRPARSPSLWDNFFYAFRNFDTFLTGFSCEH
jgi:hypothetical protein